MTSKDKRSKIIKPIIIILLLLGVALSYEIYLRYRNVDFIEYAGHGYSIRTEITSKDEIASIKKECPYTQKRDNGYKIYAGKNATQTGEIYVEKRGKFYNVELKGSL